MEIGELAKATGALVETIRFYEREGLLPEAERTDGNYRVYSPAHALTACHGESEAGGTLSAGVRI